LHKIKLRPQAVGDLLSASHLLAWLQGRAGIEWADVAAKRVTSIMHPVIHCEWPRWNDGVWCLIYQPLIVTCCMPYGPLHGTKHHSQHQNCSQVMMVPLDEAGVRQPVTDVTKDDATAVYVCQMVAACNVILHEPARNLQTALADLTMLPS